MDKFLTAILLTVAIFSYRTVLTGQEPGGGREAEQMQNIVTLMATQ